MDTILIKSIVTIFFLLNSFGTLPIFLSLTSTYSFREKLATSFIATVTASVLLLIFIWTGNLLMNFLGLSIAAFEIGGGILLFKIGMEMLNLTVDIEKVLKRIPENLTMKSNAIVPLGIPLLAGPGSVAIVITMTIREVNTIGLAGISLAMVIAAFLSFLVWMAGGYLLLKYKLQLFSDLISRLGGLFLIILAVQMIINGLQKIMT